MHTVIVLAITIEYGLCLSNNCTFKIKWYSDYRWWMLDNRNLLPFRSIFFFIKENNTKQYWWSEIQCFNNFEKSVWYFGTLARADAEDLLSNPANSQVSRIFLPDRIYLCSQTSWYWYQCHELCWQLQITIFFQGGFLVRLSPHTSGLVISVKSYSEEAGQYRFHMISISKSRVTAKRLGSVGSSYSVIIKYSDNDQENAFTMDCFNII